jgi:hypothetical protein
MEKRLKPRIAHRLVCKVAAAGTRAPGVICDVSDVGLFVETRVSPSLNSIVRLLFPETEDQPEFSIEAGVARTCIAPSQAQTALPSGIGLEVIPPRNAFERWIVHPARPLRPASNLTLSPLGSEPRTGMTRYRVRLIRQDRPGTQILTLRCESEAAARAKALSRLAGVWRIAESQPI